MAEIPIPGGTAILKDALVTERDFRLVEAAAMTMQGVAAKLPETPAGETPTDEEAMANLAQADLTIDEGMTLISFQDAAIVSFLVSWTLPQPLPTLATVPDLEKTLYRALANACVPLAQSAVEEMNTDFEPGDKPDPENPDPSLSSAPLSGPSSDGAESMSTPNLPSDGESSSTEEASTPV